MADPMTISEYGFTVVGDMERRADRPQPETPFRILVLGDFGGRARERGAALRPLAVDRDSIDAMLARLDVEIALPLAGQGEPVTIRFAAMEDFHPDRLYQRLDIFRELRDMRDSLADPAALAAFTAGLRAEPPATDTPPAPPLEGSGLLDQIIDQTAQPSSPPLSPRSGSQLDSFVRQLVRPHLLAKAHPKQQEMLDAVDRSAAELLRRILAHPRFQALEAAWRGLDFLLSRLETGEQLGVYLLDLSREELAADLAAKDDLRKSAMFRLLVAEAVQTPGGAPWAVAAGCYRLEKTLTDIGLLARLARIAAAAGAPFVAAASDQFLSRHPLHQTPDPDDWQPQAEPEASEAWQLLRSLPEAQYLGLVLPRLLLRLPYGADTEPIDSLPFEEISADGGHENHLWGNPALACALLLGQAFSGQGWRMQPGEVDGINSLPLHVYQQDGGPRTTPCAEVVLTQRAAERIMEAGLMPLLSFVNQDRVRLARFQSIAEPLSRLFGPWSRSDD